MREVSDMTGNCWGEGERAGRGFFYVILFLQHKIEGKVGPCGGKRLLIQNQVKPGHKQLAQGVKDKKEVVEEDGANERCCQWDYSILTVVYSINDEEWG
jgi:hypothetical protein